MVTDEAIFSEILELNFLTIIVLSYKVIIKKKI